MKIARSLLKSLWLFAIVLVLMTADGLPAWLLIILVVLFLTIPLIREFRTRTDLDERQIQLSHFSSHIAFYFLLGMMLIVMIFEFYSKNKEPDPVWHMIVIVPLVLKFLISLFQNYGTLSTARWIGYFFGGIWVLFVLLSHGFHPGGLLEAAPFLLIIVVAFYSSRFPLMTGLLMTGLSIGLTIFFGTWQNFHIYVRILMLSLITLPLIVAGLSLIFYTITQSKTGGIQ
jgi:hypothetical protein